MTGAFAWLNDLMIWLGRWVPRLLLIPPTHRGVRFGPRGGAREVGPGLLVYWPITHSILQVPITTQSLQPSAQVLPLFEEETLFPLVAIYSVAIQFRIVDAVKAATSVLHLHALVTNRAAAAIAGHFDPSKVTAGWMAAATEAAEHNLFQYGVKLESLDVTQAGRGMALKNLADWSYADGTAGTHSLES